MFENVTLKYSRFTVAHHFVFPIAIVLLFNKFVSIPIDSSHSIDNARLKCASIHDLIWLMIQVETIQSWNDSWILNRLSQTQAWIV